MPSSPKLYHTRPTFLFSRRSIVLLLCLGIGFLGFIFGISSILHPNNVYKCKNRHPRSVSVVWDKDRISIGNSPDGTRNRDLKRHKVMGFVGIQTGFRSAGRRQSLRKTWFPSDPQGLKRLEEATGLAFRFVIGKTSDKGMMADLREEVGEFDDFMLLDIEEEYSKLPYKTLAFFKAAYSLFESDFYVKADDDIYLRPDRLSLLLAMDRSHSQIYLGCMKKGPVFTDPKLKWYEPMSYLLGKEYFLHAYGPIYALSADVVSSLVTLRNNSVRIFSNEDVTIGALMLAMDVMHEHRSSLCQRECSDSSIAVWDIPKCSGLCNPEKKLLELHAMDICSNSPTLKHTETVVSLFPTSQPIIPHVARVEPNQIQHRGIFL